MRRLMLLRHAKTERAAPSGRDRDRKLMKRGRNDAPVIGTYMAHHGLVPDLALISPSARTQETWALVAPCFGKAPRAETDYRIYNASTSKLAEIVAETRAAKGRDIKTLLLIGHNPGFHELAVQLVASGDVDLREKLNEGLPTSGLVVIDLPLDDWALLHPHAGRLERFVTPRLLAEATE
jgi:phosphohistidine phosphatase